MTDLRDQLAAFEAAARRPSSCHPRRPAVARGLCGPCYQLAWRNNELPDKRVHRARPDFIADYELLRSEGYTRRQIAERLGMTYDGVAAAYRRAVRAGDLTPDRRTA